MLRRLSLALLLESRPSIQMIRSLPEARGVPTGTVGQTVLEGGRSRSRGAGALFYQVTRTRFLVLFSETHQLAPPQAISLDRNRMTPRVNSFMWPSEKSVLCSYAP